MSTEFEYKREFSPEIVEDSDFELMSEKFDNAYNLLDTDSDSESDMDIEKDLDTDYVEEIKKE